MPRRITTLIAPVTTPGSGGGVSGGSSALLPIASVTGQDTGHGSDQQFDRVSRLVTFVVGVKCFFASVPTQVCTMYLNRSGALWQWVGTGYWTSSGQEITFTQARPVGIETWKVSCVPGNIPGDPNALMLLSSLPAGHIESGNFSVSGLALPPATLGVNPTQNSGSGGNWPYNKTTPDRLQYFDIPDIQIDTSIAYLDRNTFAIVTTYEDLDSSHLSIGPEHIYSGVTPVNGVMVLGELDGDYLTDGFSYTRTGNIAYVRRRQYAINRVDQSTAAWANPAASTLQTDVGGGVGYIDILVALGGVPPPGEVVSTNAVSGFSFSSFFDPTFAQAIVGLVVDPFNALWGPGYLGSAVWLYSVPSPGVLTVYPSGTGLDANQYVGLRGASVNIGQLLTTTGGATHFFSVMAKSTNNASLSHELQFVVVWVDGDGVTISTSTVTLLNQYIPTWSFTSGFVQAPAGAAMGDFRFSTGSSEPAGDEWFITNLKVEGTINQTANNQTTTTAPVAGSSDYSILRGLSTIDISNSYYGRQAMILTAPDGSSVSITVGTGSGNVSVGTPTGGSSAIGPNSISVSQGSPLGAISFAVIGGVPQIIVQVSGSGFSGYNGTMSAAVAANKPIKAGIVCN